MKVKLNNKRVIIIGIFLLAIGAQAQSISINGLVQNDKGKGISFANIALQGYPVGTTSDVNGCFKLNLNQKHLNDSILVCCLNYKAKQLSIDSLLACDTIIIHMEKREYQIAEIVVKSKKKSKPITANKYKASNVNGYILCDNIPKIYARFFPYKTEYGLRNNITELNIGFQGAPTNNRFKIRIRLYEKTNNSDSPGKDILHNDLIVAVKQGINKIDLTPYTLKLPEDGIFVGIEWLIIEENKYDWTYYDQEGKEHVDIKFGPILGAIYKEKSATWLYWAGEWNLYNKEVPMVHPKIKPNTFFDAAIAITLSE